MTELWPSTDPLGEAFRLLRLSGALYTRSEFAEPWALALPALDRLLMVHIMVSGACWLEAGEAPAVRLAAGDLALVTHGNGHRVASTPGLPATGLFAAPREALSEHFEILRLGDGPAVTTEMICVAVQLDHPAAMHLVRQLPSQIIVTAAGPPDNAWQHGMLELLAAEARALRPGGEVVIARLADVLVIQAVRAWLAHDSLARTGWLGALRDQQIGRAIALMHREPGHAWTVATLADAVAMSRSAFAARFMALVGEAPMHYLTRWRMLAALTLLREGNVTLAEAASQVGYQSEAAFSRAFKRIIGVAPSFARRDAPLLRDDIGRLLGFPTPICGSRSRRRSPPRVDRGSVGGG